MSHNVSAQPLAVYPYIDQKLTIFIGDKETVSKKARSVCDELVKIVQSKLLEYKIVPLFFDNIKDAYKLIKKFYDDKKNSETKRYVFLCFSNYYFYGFVNDEKSFKLLNGEMLVFRETIPQIITKIKIPKIDDEMCYICCERNLYSGMICLMCKQKICDKCQETGDIRLCPFCRCPYHTPLDVSIEVFKNNVKLEDDNPIISVAMRAISKKFQLRYVFE